MTDQLHDRRRDTRRPDIDLDGLAYRLAQIERYVQSARIAQDPLNRDADFLAATTGLYRLAEELGITDKYRLKQYELDARNGVIA